MIILLHLLLLSRTRAVCLLFVDLLNYKVFSWLQAAFEHLTSINTNGNSQDTLSSFLALSI